MTANMRGDLTDALNKIDKEKEVFTDAVGIKLVEGENKINLVVQDAQKKFAELETGLKELFQQTAAAIHQLEAKVMNMEAQGHGTANHQGSYLPQKNMIPKVFSDKAEEWRQWTEDVADYMDSQCAGLKELLMEIDGTDEDIDDNWRKRKRDQAEYPVPVLDQVKLWRSLKRLTDGEARKVVTSVKGEDGFRAWQKLRQRFEPGLQAKRGIILLELNGMVTRPAKTPSELVGLITEMEQKIKTIEDITGEIVGEMHAHSVLIGLLDPMTRSHTAMNHGLKYEALKKIILEFANNSTATVAASQRAEPMQLGQVGEADCRCN